MVPPPKHVYSATIKNFTNSPIDLTVHYKGVHSTDHEPLAQAQLEANSGEFYAEQRLDEQESGQTYTTTKVISKIQIRKANGSILELEQPFEGVYSPVKDWQFHVHDNEIKSVKSQ
jgi:hypothetical protein